MSSSSLLDALRRRCVERRERLWRAPRDQRLRFDAAAELQVELLRWWSDLLRTSDDDSDDSDGDDADDDTKAKAQLTRDQHATLFQRLVFALQQLEQRHNNGNNNSDDDDDNNRSSVSTAASTFSALSDSDVQTLREQDWAACGASGEALTRDRVMAAVCAVAQACVYEQVAAASPQSVLDVLKALHEHAFARFPDDQFPASATQQPKNHMQHRRSASSLQSATRRVIALKRTKSTLDGSFAADVAITAAGADEPPKPQTLAEKLVRMRTQRSLLPIATAPPSDDDSSAGPSAASQSTATPLSPSTSSLVLLSSSSPSTPHRTSSSVSSRDASSLLTTDSLHDDASHYFAIETRIDLKERLKALQRQLQELLLQSKLAWMRCFATSDVDDTAPITAAVDDATRLVTTGESLATNLQLAFVKARTHSCPIDEYTAIVETVEREFAAYQALVQQLATMPSSPARQIRCDNDRHDPATMETEAVPRPGRQQMLTADLPSMRTYMAKVAPPYSAYLEPLQKTRGAKHRANR
ncbi:hypothetical protein PINS_up011646 [Pythium insidiosum]|nr:hypothetical protein PINS_up011646 [Pythium insidiosum]